MHAAAILNVKSTALRENSYLENGSDTKQRKKRTKSLQRLRVSSHVPGYQAYPDGLCPLPSSYTLGFAAYSPR